MLDEWNQSIYERSTMSYTVLLMIKSKLRPATQDLRWRLNTFSTTSCVSLVLMSSMSYELSCKSRILWGERAKPSRSQNISQVKKGSHKSAVEERLGSVRLGVRHLGIETGGYTVRPLGLLMELRSESIEWRANVG